MYPQSRSYILQGTTEIDFKIDFRFLAPPKSDFYKVEIVFKSLLSDLLPEPIDLSVTRSREFFQDSRKSDRVAALLEPLTRFYLKKKSNFYRILTRKNLSNLLKRQSRHSVSLPIQPDTIWQIQFSIQLRLFDLLISHLKQFDRTLFRREEKAFAETTTGPKELGI